MGQTIEVSDEIATMLKEQAEAHGMSLDAWVQALAREKAGASAGAPGRELAQAAAARILDLQKRVKPDPEGWTIHDYINHGRP